MPDPPSTDHRPNTLMTNHRTWVEINAAHLTHNLHAIQSAAGPATETLAVIKADAYGHGAELCAPVLARAGARFLGVTDAAEGARVRQALQTAALPDQHQLQILTMCGSLPEESPLLATHSLTPVLWTPAQLHALQSTPPLRLHIEIDTGMGRQGAKPGPELAALLEALRTSPHTVAGVFTHLCSSEDPTSATTTLQKQRFEAAIAQIRAAHLQPSLLHIANSSAVDHPAPTRDWLADLARSLGATPMVRTGLALYGYTLPTAHSHTPFAPQLAPHLHSVLTWRARILSTHTLAPGDTVGYGATFTATRQTPVALLPIGYADGLRRELSNPAPNPPPASAPTHALSFRPEAPSRSGETRSSDPAPGPARACTSEGAPLPILGRVSMNLTVLDISAAPHLAPGDPVTLLGPRFTAADHAALARTIPYEILCALRPLPHILT